MKKPTCSIGICVYNEEKNIGVLLDSLFSQRLKSVRIEEIIVIASGTTDRTVKIVNQYMKRHKRITLMKERKRQGKASAVNKFIERSTSDILVLVGGDLILTPTVIQELVGKFRSPEVGMTGARPVPVNRTNTLATRAARLLWDLHHRISLESPKMGEVIAFRKIFKRIPLLSSVDEANIEPLIRGQGYRIVYVPRAEVHNKAPSTISDFIRQRRRIYNGHLAVKHEQSYEVSTYRIRSILTALMAVIRENPRISTFFLIAVTASLEGTSRTLGWWDYRISKKRHTVWEVVASTKNPGD
ncbi:glycosyltransferase [Candidatus Microgenomates bacterium]|nr:glycosyltransferase [Candidatus Microgenomates bacterium]